MVLTYGKTKADQVIEYLGNLVPRVFVPLTSCRKTRALGTTGMRHGCRLRSETGWAEFDYFLCYFKTVAPRAPRALVFRPLVKGNEDCGNEIGVSSEEKDGTWRLSSKSQSDTKWSSLQLISLVTGRMIIMQGCDEEQCNPWLRVFVPTVNTNSNRPKTKILSQLTQMFHIRRFPFVQSFKPYLLFKGNFTQHKKKTTLVLSTSNHCSLETKFGADVLYRMLD